MKFITTGEVLLFTEPKEAADAHACLPIGTELESDGKEILTQGKGVRGDLYRFVAAKVKDLDPGFVLVNRVRLVPGATP